MKCEICKRSAHELRFVYVSDFASVRFCDLCAVPQTLAHYLLKRIDDLEKKERADDLQ